VKESAWWEERPGWSDECMSFVIERDRLLARVQAIDRLIRKQFQLPGNDTVH
jgi:hypothetical protein